MTPDLKEKQKPRSTDVLMTNYELFNLFSALVDVQDVEADPRFTYAVAKNLEQVRPVAERFDSEFQVPESYAEYERQRVNVCIEHAKKDAQGRAIMDGESFVIDRHDEFRVAIEALRAEHEEAIEEYRRTCEEFAKALREGGPTVDLHRVPLTCFPKLTALQMEGLLPMAQPDG